MGAGTVRQDAVDGPHSFDRVQEMPNVLTPGTTKARPLSYHNWVHLNRTLIFDGDGSIVRTISASHPPARRPLSYDLMALPEP